MKPQQPTVQFAL